MLCIGRRFGLVAAVIVLGGGVAAQCPIPDGLDGGPCCTKVKPRIPRIRKAVQEAIEICWKDCDEETVVTCRATWRPSKVAKSNSLFSDPCGPRLLDFALIDGTGKIKWRGRLATVYSRTWLETTPAGVDYQVWRFLWNGDLRPTTAAGMSPCPVPPCAATHKNRVRFSGYIDQAWNCTTGAFEHAWMLTHACDVIDHAPGFPRAGPFHPDRAYTFVGPSTAFVPAALLPIETGASTLEDVRRVNLPPPGSTVPPSCEYEERVNHVMDPQQQLCVCFMPGVVPPNQWSLSTLSLTGGCGTSITTPGMPYLPGFLSMGIGAWTDPTTYPGEELLRWNAGGYDYADPCTGVTRREVFFGVTTFEGYAAKQIVSAGTPVTLPLTFVDQANSLTLAGLTLMNVPFLSDHILNLNY